MKEPKQRMKGNSFNKFRIRRSNKHMSQTVTNLEVQVLDQEDTPHVMSSGITTIEDNKAEEEAKV